MNPNEQSTCADMCAQYPTVEEAPATLTITVGGPGRALEFTADPTDGTVSIMADMTYSDDLIFEVEEFGLIAMLLAKVAGRV